MKRLALALAKRLALALALLGQTAQAGSLYLEAAALGSLPLNVDQNSIEARNAISPGVELAIGKRLNDWLRVHGRLRWDQWHVHGYGNQSADGDVNVVNLGIGAYLNPPVDNWLSYLYVGGEVGPALERIDGSNGSRDGERHRGSNIELGYSGRVGIQLPVGDLVIDLGYGYLTTTGHTEGHGPRLAIAVPLQ